MNGIAIASPSEEFLGRVHEAYGVSSNGHTRHWHEGLQTTDLPVLVEEVASTNPRVVVVGPGLYDGPALMLVEAFDSLHPDIVTVMVAPPSPELWPAAIHAGARDVIAPDAAPHELRAALDRALRVAELCHARVAATPVQSNSTDASRTVCIVSPKGGSGKTTMATNIAVGLAQIAPGQVVLVDLDLQFGCVEGALGLQPEQSIADAARLGAGLDAGTLKVFLTAHPMGLFALCAPDSLAQADDVTADQLSRIVSLLSADFRYVVIDTAAGLDVVTLAAIEFSTDLVFVATPDVASVRALRRAMEAFDMLGLKSQARHYVVNRAGAKGGLEIDDIRSVTDGRIDAEIPDSRAVALSLNLGTPIIESDPDSAPGKALAGFVGLLAGVDLQAQQGRGGSPSQRRGFLGRRKAQS